MSELAANSREGMGNLLQTLGVIVAPMNTILSFLC